MYGHGKCVADIGGRYLGNLSYGAQRPSIMSQYGTPSPSPRYESEAIRFSRSQVAKFKESGELQKAEAWQLVLEEQLKYDE